MKRLVLLVVGLLMLGKTSPWAVAQAQPAVVLSPATVTATFAAPSGGNQNYGTSAASTPRFKIQVNGVPPTSTPSVKYTVTYTHAQGNTAVEKYGIMNYTQVTPPAVATANRGIAGGASYDSYASFTRNQQAAQLAGTTCGTFTVIAEFTWLNPSTGLQQVYKSNTIQGTVKFAGGTSTGCAFVLPNGTRCGSTAHATAQHPTTPVRCGICNSTAHTTANHPTTPVRCGICNSTAHTTANHPSVNPQRQQQYVFPGPQGPCWFTALTGRQQQSGRPTNITGGRPGSRPIRKVVRTNYMSVKNGSTMNRRQSLRNYRNR